MLNINLSIGIVVLYASLAHDKFFCASLKFLPPLWL